MEASAAERDTPTSACFKAEQSLAPSPHIPTSALKNFYNYSTSKDLSSGNILA